MRAACGQALAFLAEQRAAACAHLDGMVLARMGKFRLEVARQAARHGVAPENLVVMAGPFYREGITIRAVKDQWLVENAPSPETASLPPASPGVMRCFVWNHEGFSTFRTFPMGRLPEIRTAPDQDTDTA